MVKMIIKINLSGYAKVIHIDIVNKVSQASSSPVADTNLLSFREFSKLLHINNTNKWKGLTAHTSAWAARRFICPRTTDAW